MIRAVLWDFGGVLTTSPFEAFNRFELERRLPRDFIRGINATNPETNAWARFESSETTLDQFDLEFEKEARAAGYPVRGRQVVELLSGDIRPRMVAALKECKKRFKVGCLTNNVKSGEGPAMAPLSEQAKGSERAERSQRVMQLFDVIVESSKEGIRKPNPKFYQLACTRLGIAPADALFLDDLGINLKPARALGMTTIKVTSEAEAIAELERVLGIKVPQHPPGV